MYTYRLKNVMKSKLNGASKILASNAYAMPVLTYTAGIVKWTKEELSDLDRKTRKILTIYKAFHPRGDVPIVHAPKRRRQGA